MLPTPDFISTFIEQQFPAFYRDEGRNFIMFVKAYYEWLEETGQTSNKTRNLFSTRDIDQTADAFVENFKRKYLYGIPKEIAGNKRFLQKHILDLYRSKGSNEGLKLLFRLLFNEEIDVYIPSYDILKASDGTWVEKKYIEASFTPFNYNFNNKIITGVSSGATAFVESFERVSIDNKILNIFYISNIQGNFSVDEKIVYEGLSAVNAPRILGSPVTLDVNGTVPNNKTGDILLPSVANGTGKGLKAIISSIRNAGTSNATIDFKVINGGYGYTANPTITITTGANSSGSGATFTGVTLKNTNTFTYSTSYINYAPYYPVTKTFNAYSSVSNTDDFITVLSHPFSNGARVLYTTSAGNTALTGLTNNTSYYVITSNASGFRLTSSYSVTQKTFNANTSVANTTDFISITSNPFTNGTVVAYTVSAGNTAIGGLVANATYRVIGANSTGLRLASAYYTSVATFKANSQGVTSISDFITTLATNDIANGDLVFYYTSAGNTALTGLTNASYYYAISANTTGLKLASTYGGANINITASAIAESGHNLARLGSVIDITSGNTESGHTLTSYGSVINVVSSVSETGHNFYRDAVIRFDANAGVANTTEYITSLSPHAFANGDKVTYLVETGNTAVSGLSNNTNYYIVGANSTAFKLATGNSTTYNTTPINITSGATQLGHTIKAINVSSLALNSVTYGSSLNNANLSTVIDSALTSLTTTIGTIDKLTGINPGTGYDGYVSVTIEDPIVGGFGIPDGYGGIKGKDAIVHGNVVIGTGLTNSVRIANSGFGYHTKLEQLYLYNSSQSNNDQTSLVTITLGGVGSQEGFWSTTRGFLDSNKHLQDSYYYQEYSYEIKSSKSLDKYLKVLKDVFHPVGNEVFGKSFIFALDESQSLNIDNPVTIFRILGSDLAGEISFDANSGVANTTEYITIIGIQQLSVGDEVKYIVDAGNTAIGGMSNNSVYFVIAANSTTIQLSNTVSGSPINITSKYTETGHHLIQSAPVSGNTIFNLNISRLT